MIVIWLILLGEIASCSASDFPYSYPFLHSVGCCLSVVCHIRAPCLNRSTDLHATWQVRLWGTVTHCVRWGSLTPHGKRRFWGLNPQHLHLSTYDAPGSSTGQRFRSFTELLRPLVSGVSLKTTDRWRHLPGSKCAPTAYSIGELLRLGTASHYDTDSQQPVLMVAQRRCL